MSDRSLQLILERAQEDEHQASLALNQARIDLDSYREQLAQIEQYRFDYCRQLSERGMEGLSASAYNHLQKFLNQLDETLLRQREAGRHFEQQVEICSGQWQDARKQRRSIEWLLEKKQHERQLRLEKQEQKLMDEFSTLQFARLMANRRSEQ
ncbi:flagellar biogenesis protein [Photobacterium aquae]|uniref:Flagellar FliJ protein n=1 Tax=Photobacterium aquae TaxID=1195763 RepID=A0A0J1H247_9GAMM|nr:flagellar export protein FliJ [Photobacterium aquae]KLV05870.1 flagellar biogenesis protein [Photobacterium aquae]